jgi:colanic acid/amylovoran biosynthesis glycosyltransferase
MKKGVRIAYLVEEFPRPSEAFIVREIEGLEAQGAEIHLYAVRPPKYLGTANTRPRARAVTYLPSIAEAAARPGFILGAAKRLRKVTQLFAALGQEPERNRLSLLKDLPRADYLARDLKRRSITHLHAHFASRPANIALLAFALYGVPFSFSAHAWDISVYGDFLREKLRRARFVVACTEEGKRRLAQIVGAGLAAAHVVKIHHGIDLARFAFSPPLLVREPPKTIQVLSIARLVEKKGLRYLVDACEALRKHQERFFCRIIGEGSGERELRELIRARNVEQHVQILPFCSQDELMEHYRRAHIVVLPSIVCPDGDRDGIPNVLVEAMSLGVPVVSTRTASIQELIVDGESGVLVSQRDPTALAEAIRFIARNPDVAARMAQRARSVVEERFDLRKTSAELFRLFSTSALHA